MARQTILGNDLVIYIDTVTPIASRPVTDVNYKLIACLTGNGLEVSTADIDTTSKCSGRFTETDSGDVTWSFSGDGNAIDDQGPSEVSYQELLDLSLSGVKFWAKIANPTDSIVREGVVRIASYSEDFQRNAAFAFSATFNGSGELFTIALT